MAKLDSLPFVIDVTFKWEALLDGIAGIDTDTDTVIYIYILPEIVFQAY